jgi:hypothetical protein
MPRRITLTPEQNEILRLLEEAGEETLGTILNTLRVEPCSSGTLSLATGQAFRGLVELGLIECHGCADGLPLDAAAFDAATAMWRTKLMASGKPLNIILTAAGERALVT